MGIQFIGFLLLLSLGGQVYAASCCGGGNGFVSLNTSDFKQKLNYQFSSSLATHFSDNEGVMTARTTDHQQIRETLSLSYSRLQGAYWQWGVEVSGAKNTLRTSVVNESYYGVADVQIVVGNEVLPELSYSLWKPRVFIYFSQAVPLAKSNYTSQSPHKLDVLGASYPASKIGVLLIKVINSVDFSLSSQLNQGWNNKDSEGVLLHPGLVTTLNGGAGYSPMGGQWRFGTSLNYDYFQPHKSKGVFIGGSSSVLGVAVSASYMVSDGSALNFSISDQSYLGVAKNSVLNKTLQVGFTQQY